MENNDNDYNYATSDLIAELYTNHPMPPVAAKTEGWKSFVGLDGLIHWKKKKVEVDKETWLSARKPVVFRERGFTDYRYHPDRKEVQLLMGYKDVWNGSDAIMDYVSTPITEFVSVEDIEVYG